MHFRSILGQTDALDLKKIDSVKVLLSNTSNKKERFKLYYYLAEAYLERGDNDSTEKFLDLFHQNLKDLKPKNIAEYYSIKSSLNHKKNEFDSSIFYINKALFLDSTNPKYYGLLSIGYNSKGKFKEALEVGILGFKKTNIEENQNKDGVLLYQAIGNVYQSLNNQREAINYYKKSIPLIKKSDVPEARLIYAYKTISIFYSILFQKNNDSLAFKDSSELYLNKLLSIGDKTESKELKARIFQTHAYYLLNDKAPSKEDPLIYIQKSFKAENSFHENAMNYQNTLHYFSDYKYNKDSLIKYIEIIKPQLNKTSSSTKRAFYYRFYLCYLSMKDYENSLRYFLQQKKINDSLLDESRRNEIEEIRIAYETEKKEIENASLKKDKQILKYNNYIVIGVCIILALILFILYLNFKKVNQQKILQEDKLELQKEIIKTHIDQIQSQNEKIKELKNKPAIQETEIDYLTDLINASETDNQKWAKILIAFNQLYPNYINEMEEKASEKLTKNDKKLLMLIKLNYSSQQIADILYVSIHAVNKSRQRLNKKTSL